MKLYLYFLALAYTIGATLHLLDVLDMRLEFSKMDLIWKAWIVYLLLFDAIAATGLWLNKKFGEYIFILVAVSQLIAYTVFSNFFGLQYPLIIFHLLTLGGYFYLSKKMETRI